MVRLPKPSKVCQMVNLVTVASHRTLKLTLAVVGLAGLLGAFVITGTSPSTDSISADETVKQKSTYTIKRERRYQVERYDADSEDRSVKARWDVYAVSDFELNDDIIVDDYYFSSVLDLFMADWMSFEFQSGRSRTDRLFIDGVERVLIDVPGCPLILTTDHRYRRPGDHNWWSFVVQVDRQDTYDQDMSRCHLVIQEYAAFTIGWIPVLILELGYLTAWMRHVLEIPLWESIATPIPTPTPSATPTPTATPTSTVEAQPTAIISPEHPTVISDVFHW